MEDVWFKNWFNSPYYHKLYAHRDEAEAEIFINNLVQLIKPNDKAKMLDVACGKGRHSMHLANMGFDVTGIDLSSESIAEALLNQSDNLHFYEHDMRLPFYINYFDLIFNFFTSFGYFNTQREHDHVIKNIVTSLKPQGIFVIDYLNIQYAINNQKATETKIIDTTNYEISKWSDLQYFYKKIVVSDQNLSNPIQYTEKVAKFSLADFTKMFDNNGLTILNVLGNYQLEQYDKTTSQRLIIIAQKNPF